MTSRPLTAMLRKPQPEQRRAGIKLSLPFRFFAAESMGILPTNCASLSTKTRCQAVVRFPILQHTHHCISGKRHKSGWLNGIRWRY